MERIEPIGDLVGQLVVLDMQSPWVFVGRLAQVGPTYLVLDDADAHDLRDTGTTREMYVLASRQHGVSQNRRRVWVSIRDLVAVSRLDDVILE